MIYTLRFLLSSLICISVCTANDIEFLDKAFSKTYFQIDEVCDNGIDDDGDGYIDAFDPDCSCGDFNSQNLVLNGDFESSSGCCFSLGQKSHCLDDWHLVTISPDYNQVNCTNDLILLDDAGIVYDGSLIGFGLAGTRTESIGTCLASPIQAGNNYRLNISLAALENVFFKLDEDVNMVVYGLQACSALIDHNIEVPFCESPLASNAVELFKVNMNSFPNNLMKTFEHEFTVQNDIEAIVIYADCEQTGLGNLSPYFYMDDVEIYAEGSVFSYDSQISTTGDNCSLAFPRIAVDEQLDINYQWYKDSMPIPNATHHSYGISTEHARGSKFHVLASGQGGCKLIGPYKFEGNINEYIVDTICIGDQYVLGDTILMTAGTYSRNLGVTSLGCDSIVSLELNIAAPLDEKFEITPALNAPAGETISILPEIGFLNQLESFYWEEGNATEKILTSQYDAVSDEAASVQLTFYYDDKNGCSSSVSFMLEWTGPTSSDEICDNGIDDDGDGFIDVFDTDCNCASMTSSTEYEMTGNVCSEEVLIETQLTQSATYQWYSDEVAIDGEVSNSLRIDKTLYTSVFHVSVMDAGACSLIGPIMVRQGELDKVIDATFCDGYAYEFEGRMVSGTGPYQLVSNDEYGCLVSTTLNLTKIPTVYNSITETICKGELYSFRGQDLSAAGIYQDTLFGMSSVGCDSIIELNLIVDDEILVNIEDTINAGEYYLFSEEQLTLSGVYRDTIFSEDMCDSILILTLEVLEEEVVEDVVFDIYIPNVFNPVSSSDNSKFMIYADRDVSVREMQIYDRWGNEVYQRKDFMIDDDKGSSWDGTFNGQLVAEGVYSYKIILEDAGVGDEYYQGQLLLVY